MDGNLAGDSLTGQVQGEVHFFVFPESGGLIFLPPTNEVREGNVCSRVCLSGSHSVHNL